VSNVITAGGASSVIQNMTGDANIVTNTIKTGGTAGLSQNITGGFNSIKYQISSISSNTFENSGSVTDVTTINGSNNTVNNFSTTTTGGARNIEVHLASGGNTVTNTFDGSGSAESSTVSADAGSTVNYTYNATGGSGTKSSTTSLTAVMGNGAAGNIRVAQAAAGTSSTLNIDGTVGYIGNTTLGGLGGVQNLGAYVNQTSANATSNVTVAGAAPGFTIYIKQ
jgi:hypothetical protein